MTPRRMVPALVLVLAVPGGGALAQRARGGGGHPGSGGGAVMRPSSAGMRQSAPRMGSAPARGAYGGGYRGTPAPRGGYGGATVRPGHVPGAYAPAASHPTATRVPAPAPAATTTVATPRGSRVLRWPLPVLAAPTRSTPTTARTTATATTAAPTSTAPCISAGPGTDGTVLLGQLHLRADLLLRGRDLSRLGRVGRSRARPARSHDRPLDGDRRRRRTGSALRSADDASVTSTTSSVARARRART